MVQIYCITSQQEIDRVLEKINELQCTWPQPDTFKGITSLLATDKVFFVSASLLSTNGLRVYQTN